MENVGKTIGKIIIIILLIFFVIGFIFVYSINQYLNEVNLKNIAKDIVKQELNSQFSEKVGENITLSPVEDYDINFEEVRTRVLDECSGKDSLSFENFDYQLDCNEIREINPVEFEDFAKNKLDQQIQLEIDGKFEEFEVPKYLYFLKLSIWISGIISLCLLFSLYFLSANIHKFLFNIGLVGLISGFPYFILKIFDFNLTKFFLGYSYIQGLYGLIIQKLSSNFLTIFIIGLILLLFEFFIMIVSKKRKKV